MHSLLTLVTFFIAGTHALDRFFLSQCDCADQSFSSVENTGEVGTFTFSADNGGLLCPVGDRGVIRDFDADVIASLTGSIQSSFFNNGGARSMWYSVIEVDLSSITVDQTFTLAELNIGTQGPFPLTVQTASTNAVFRFGGTFAVTATDPDFNRVVIGEFENDLGGGLILSGLFVCAGPDAGDLTACGESADFVPAVGVVSNAATVNFLGLDNNNVDSARLRSFAFEQEDTFLKSIQTAEPADITTLIQGVDLTAGALPVFNNVPIDAVEDIVLQNVDLNAFLVGPSLTLDFTVSDPLDITGFGTLSGFNATAGVFDLFTPVGDAFGSATFSFSYTDLDLPYECTLTVDNAVIEIASAEDIPILIAVDPVATVAFVDVVVSQPVALSIDFPVNGEPGTLLEGFVHIATLPTGGTLFESDCSTALNVTDEVALNSGNFEFCYQGNEQNLDGDTDSFTYTVRPPSNLVENAAVGEGTITLLGGTPVFVNPDVTTRAQFFVEDSQDEAIVVDATNFAVLADGLVNFDFQVQIITLPDPSVGVLSFGGEEVVEGDIFNSGDSIIFNPAADFFNANSGGTETNDAGINLFGNDCLEAEKIRGVCPDTFTFQVLFGDVPVVSENATFGLIVAAVDDAGASFTVEQNDTIVVNTLDVRSDGFITATGTELQVTSDNGADVFNIGVRYVGIGGTQIQLPTPVLGDPQGFRLDGGILGPEDCVANPCDVMHLIGTQEQLNSFLSSVIFLVPAQEQNEVSPSVSVTLASGVDSNNLINNVGAYDDATLTEVEFEVQTVIDGALPADRFFFDQCACLASTFPTFAVDNVGASSDFDTTEAVSCPTDAQRGFIRAATDTSIPVSGSVGAPLFTDDVNQRTSWLSVFEVDLNALADTETVTIASFLFPNSGVFDLKVQNVAGVASVGVNEVTALAEIDIDSDVKTVVFGEFSAITTGIFVCVGSSSGINCGTFNEQAASSGFLTGIINAPVTVSLLTGFTGQVSSVRLQGMAFVEATIVDDNSDEIEAILDAVDLEAAALPVFNGEQISAVEDIVLENITLSDFLEGSDIDLVFTVTDPFVIENFGTFATFSEDTFETFTPARNIFGRSTFSFAYEAAASENLPYECQLTIDNVVVDIEPVEDAPVLIAVGELNSVAFVQREFSVPVAVTIDNPDNDGNEGPLLEGFVQILELPSAGTLFFADCVTEILLNSTVALNSTNGNFEFCYEGSQGNVAGESDSFTYTVRPASNDEANTAEGNQTITLLGGNPVVPNPNFNDRFQQFVEDSGNNDILVDLAKFAELDPSLDSFDFRVEIVTFPDPAIGSIADSGNPNPAEFALGENIVFAPGANFFNANADGGLTNDAGENVIDVDCSANEQINGVCVDTIFTYRVLFGSDPAVASDPVAFSAIVTATDDGGASFAVLQQAPITVDAVTARNGLIRINGADLQVASDLGNDIFNIGMRFVVVGGVQIQLPAQQNGDPVGFRLDDGVVGAVDCIDEPCDIMHLIGTPSQLNNFIDEIQFIVPAAVQDNTEPQVDVTLASGVIFDILRDDVNQYDANTLTEILFEVEELEEGFFDDPINLAAVAGGGGGLLIIIAAVVIIRATRVRANKDKRPTALTASRKEFKQRGTLDDEKAPRKKRSFEEDDDEPANNLDDEL